jgi:hypothetical protein
MQPRAPGGRGSPVDATRRARPVRRRLPGELSTADFLRGVLEITRARLPGALQSLRRARCWARLPGALQSLTRPVERLGAAECEQLAITFAEFVEILDPIRREAVEASPPAF